MFCIILSWWVQIYQKPIECILQRANTNINYGLIINNNVSNMHLPVVKNDHTYKILIIEELGMAEGVYGNFYKHKAAF